MHNAVSFRYFKTSPEIIHLAVMLYVSFPLSLRNVEDLLHERGVDVSYETVRPTVQPLIMYHFLIEFLELAVSCLGLGEGGCLPAEIAMVRLRR